MNNEAKDFAAERSYGKGDTTHNAYGNNKFQKKFERKDDCYEMLLLDCYGWCIPLLWVYSVLLCVVCCATMGMGN